WIDTRKTSLRIAATYILVIAVLLAMVLQFGKIAGYQVIKYAQLELSAARLAMSDIRTLRHWPSFSAVEYLRNAKEPIGLVLAERPADMYYSGRRMVSYLDPRLLPVYKEKDPERACE